MIEQLLHYKSYVQRYLDAPLLQEREAYIQNMYDRGLCRSRILATANYLVFFVKELELCDECYRPISIEDINKCAHVWANKITKCSLKRMPRSASYDRIANIAIDFLRQIGRLDTRYDDKSNIFNTIIERVHQKREYFGSPLYAERLRYMEYCKNKGFSHDSLIRIAKFQIYFTLSINDLGKRDYTDSDIENIANAVIQNPKFRINSDRCKRHFIWHITQWLSNIGWYKPNIEEAYYGKDILNQYLKWGLENKGYTANSIRHKRCRLKQFLGFLSNQKYTLSGLTTNICDEYILECFNERKNKRHTIAGIVSELRCFLRFAGEKGWCPKSMDSTFRAPRLYKMEILPAFAPWENVLHILDKYSKQQDDTSIRDYPILLLLSIYGLRCGEVANLRLTDISWRKSKFILTRSKRCKPQVFPLIQSVGEALIHYLRDVRPKECRLETVFVSMKAPFRPITTSGIYQMVRRNLKEEGLQLDKYGPHCLRYSCATNLLRRNHNMKEIADLLGHQNIETTMVYTKVDLNNLNKVSEMEWEELL